MPFAACATRSAPRAAFGSHFAAALAVVVAGLLLRVGFLEWSLLVLCITGVWVAEMFNTALEALARAVSEDAHPQIRLALDVASAAVLVASLGAAIVGGTRTAARLALSDCSRTGLGCHPERSEGSRRAPQRGQSLRCAGAMTDAGETGSGTDSEQASDSRPTKNANGHEWMRGQRKKIRANGKGTPAPTRGVLMRAIRGLPAEVSPGSTTNSPGVATAWGKSNCQRAPTTAPRRPPSVPRPLTGPPNAACKDAVDVLLALIRATRPAISTRVFGPFCRPAAKSWLPRIYGPQPKELGVRDWGLGIGKMLGAMPTLAAQARRAALY